MSCASFKRGGFLMRSFLPFGSLVVSRGFGSCGDEIIVFPTDPLEGLQQGTGRRVRINVRAPRPPKPLIRYPDKKSGKCED